MAIPFSVGPDGSVDFVADPVEALSDRVRALASTSPGQRVMRATFGVATSDLVFSWDAAIGQAQLQQRVQDAVSQWEPAARVLAARPLLDPSGAQVTGVAVDVSAGDPVALTDVPTQYAVLISGTGTVVRQS